MANITITIPDAVAPRVLDAMAARYGWASASGLTKAQLLKETVKMYEGQIASSAAMTTSNQQVDTDIVIS